jgi:glycine C-acetyltransferase
MLRPVLSALADPFSCDTPGALMRFVGGTEGRRHGQTDRAQQSRPGMNFAMQDYLALASHPAVRAAALASLGHHRLAAPGPAPRHGLTAPVLALETRLASFLGLPAATTFASGSEAIRLTLQTLLRPGDEVIIDSDAHPAMFESVLIAKAHLHRSPSGLLEGVERRLNRLVRQHRRGRLVIAVPAVSAHGSRLAELAELAALARLHGAVLIVDVSHDLGAMGQTGVGTAEIQGCIGRVDIVLGSFAKTFAASGGFAAFRDPALKSALHAGQWRTTALSPVNASAILAALDIVSGPEGKRRRRNLHGIALRLRNHLMADGVKVMGKASPLVPILLPHLTALPRTALLESAGPQVTLLQAPSVAAHAPRWRIQLNADHSPADIDDLAELIRDVTRAFDRQPARTRVPA